jgi:hypothetical protein
MKLARTAGGSLFQTGKYPAHRTANLIIANLPVIVSPFFQ